jgi:hypothetical protein
MKRFLFIFVLALSSVSYSAIYTTLGAGSSFLKPIFTDSKYEITKKNDFSFKAGFGFDIDESFILDFGYADLGVSQVKNKDINKVIDVDYQQLTAGIIYQPESGLSFAPFLTVGVRNTLSSFKKENSIHIYNGVGFDIGFDTKYDPDLRFSYINYSDDAGAIFVEVIKRW